jgi:diguanylate cyclase (GGDEF)-like protein
LLSNTDIEGASVLAENMRIAIEAYSFSHHIELTCSFGVASTSSNHQDATDLLRRADRALYEAKNQGRNRVVIAR